MIIFFLILRIIERERIEARYMLRNEVLVDHVEIASFGDVGVQFYPVPFYHIVRLFRGPYIRTSNL